MYPVWRNQPVWPPSTWSPHLKKMQQWWSRCRTDWDTRTCPLLGSWCPVDGHSSTLLWGHRTDLDQDWFKLWVSVPEDHVTESTETWDVFMVPPEQMWQFKVIFIYIRHSKKTLFTENNRLTPTTTRLHVQMYRSLFLMRTTTTTTNRPVLQFDCETHSRLRGQQEVVPVFYGIWYSVPANRRTDRCWFFCFDCLLCCVCDFTSECLFMNQGHWKFWYLKTIVMVHQVLISSFFFICVHLWFPPLSLILVLKVLEGFNNGPWKCLTLSWRPQCFSFDVQKPTVLLTGLQFCLKVCFCFDLWNHITDVWNFSPGDE